MKFDLFVSTSCLPACNSLLRVFCLRSFVSLTFVRVFVASSFVL